MIEHIWFYGWLSLTLGLMSLLVSLVIKQWRKDPLVAVMALTALFMLLPLELIVLYAWIADK